MEVEVKLEEWGTSPHPVFFVSVAFKGVVGISLVSADSKGV
jgi:hypothetical protein